MCFDVWFAPYQLHSCADCPLSSLATPPGIPPAQSRRPPALSECPAAAFGMYGLGLTLVLQMAPYTGLVDDAGKNLMYGFAIFFAGLVSPRGGVWETEVGR